MEELTEEQLIEIERRLKAIEEQQKNIELDIDTIFRRLSFLNLQNK